MATARAKTLAKALAVQSTQVGTLQTLLRLTATGHDVSPAAEEVVRYCLESSMRNNLSVLSLALDLLIACPGHGEWDKVRKILVAEVSHGRKGAAIVLTRVEGLPGALIAGLVNDAGFIQGVAAMIRKGGVGGRAAVRAAGGVVLRAKVEGDRQAVETLWTSLLQAVEGGSEGVRVEALRVMTEFAARVDGTAGGGTVAMATRKAMAVAVWDLLAERVRAIAGGLKETVAGRVDSLLDRREAIKGLARIAAAVLALKAGILPEHQMGKQALVSQQGLDVEVNDIVKWAILWVDKHLVRCCDDTEPSVVFTACLALLHVCSHATPAFFEEKRSRWGEKATTKLSRWVFDYDRKVSLVQISTASNTAVMSLAALAKGNSSGKYISTTAVQLLPFAAKIPNNVKRLEALCTLATTAIEFDLSGKEGATGALLSSLTSSKSWREIIGTGNENSMVPSELVSCFAQSCLDASRKIVPVLDSTTKTALTDAWALMVAKLLLRSAPCLSWPYSPSVSFAREMFLKLFEALGQYTAFLVRTRGTSLTEYERIQELLVRALMRQEDIKIRASLLACITNYWLASGLKAEGSAGVVLKGVWLHAQEHYRDDELMLSEMRRGALWSSAQKGFLTPRQRATAGGYISVTTAIMKKTSSVVGAVGSAVNEAFEKRLFGSLALQTAAGEGSTLTTDYAYTSFSAALALVRNVPRAAERILRMVKRYHGILEKAESADFLVLEYVSNIISAIEMYKDDFFPKLFPSRTLRSTRIQEVDDPCAWLKQITESCVQATSRLDDSKKEMLTVQSEEEVLHASMFSRQRSQSFHVGSLKWQSTPPGAESDKIVLTGTSDSFRILASHSMDTMRGLANVTVHIMNRTDFPVVNGFLFYGVGGALTFLPDAATTFSLGSLSPGEEVSNSITFAVHRNQGSKGSVHFSISASDDSTDRSAQQVCMPYCIPSSEILLLKPPSRSAGVDVFRRRWDLMREASKVYIYLRERQTMDDLMDMLQRVSGCLRLVGRMRKASQVGLFVADSTRGDYIAVAAVAPEAGGQAGQGPCFVYITIRSHSKAYCDAFRKELKEWLSSSFKVILGEGTFESQQKEPVKPQDVYFVTTDDSRTPYQRWRDAHRLRTML